LKLQKKKTYPQPEISYPLFCEAFVRCNAATNDIIKLQKCNAGDSCLARHSLFYKGTNFLSVAQRPVIEQHPTLTLIFCKSLFLLNRFFKNCESCPQVSWIARKEPDWEARV